MKYKILKESNHVDSELGFLCRYVRSNTERFVPHSHDYFELFMVVKGSVLHIINSKKQILKEGHFLFIRDFDVHDYLSEDGENFEFLNLAISKKMFQSVIDYLGDDFQFNQLINSDAPPVTLLSTKEREKIFFSLTELDPRKNKSIARLRIKALLIDVFTKYFTNYNMSYSDIPFWLERTYEKMKKPANFIEGTTKMLEISGKTREHLTRSLKKYYNTSPTELVNDLRLDYCATLLTKSNLPIIDISMNCGFDNLSWFYKVFQKKYNMTPSEYRKQFEITKNPSSYD